MPESAQTEATAKLWLDKKSFKDESQHRSIFLRGAGGFNCNYGKALCEAVFLSRHKFHAGGAPVMKEKLSKTGCKVAIIVPYFQKEAGILRKSLASVWQQTLPQGHEICVIVVDDGSAVPACLEMREFSSTSSIRMICIEQDNLGVAEARNTGLRAVDADTDYIAFLDSDDLWPQSHLLNALKALQGGSDLYFCDNKREGSHHSHFDLGQQLLASVIDVNNSIHRISGKELFSIVLRDAPIQLSTLVYRRSLDPTMAFPTGLRWAGEDIFFVLALVAKANEAAFSNEEQVLCGSGVNIYFSNLGWDSPGRLRQLLDRLTAHIAVQTAFPLRPADDAYNKVLIASLRMDFAFLTLRRLIRNKVLPCEWKQCAAEDKSFLLWFTWASLKAIGKRLMGDYKMS